MAATKTRRDEAGRGEAAPVVAEVLADGSVRATESGRRQDREDPFAIGQLAGDGWILWWQRRRLED